MSNKEFSPELTLGDVISAAGKLKSLRIKPRCVCRYPDALRQIFSFILPLAFLARHSKFAIGFDEYPSANETSLDASMENMLTSLLVHMLVY